jgi:hypothetical protein
LKNNWDAFVVEKNVTNKINDDDVEKVLNGYYSKTAFISQLNPVFNNVMIFLLPKCDKMPVP